MAGLTSAVLAYTGSTMRFIPAGAALGRLQNTGAWSFPLANVTSVTVEHLRVTLRLTISLADGSQLVGEAKRSVANRPNVAVI